MLEKSEDTILSNPKLKYEEIYLIPYYVTWNWHQPLLRLQWNSQGFYALCGNFGTVNY